MSVVYEKDLIKIYDKTKYWLYVLKLEQWKILQSNFKKKHMYISSYDKYDVSEDDIIIFYIRDLPKGIIALGQTFSKMIKNTENVEIYNDMNMNRYCIELNNIIIYDKSRGIKSFEFTLVDKYTSFISFCKEHIKGDNTFNHIICSDVGLKLSKLILQKKEIVLNEKKVEKKLDKVLSNVVYEEINDNLVRNIPIMLIPCSQLVRNVDNILSEFISNIIKHYKFCKMCERVNKNIYELVLTLNNIDLDDIEIIYDNDDILKNYLNDTLCENMSNIEYVKIHIIKKDNIILFEYTTLVENLY
jgi:hypothetical protein